VSRTKPYAGRGCGGGLFGKRRGCVEQAERLAVVAKRLREGSALLVLERAGLFALVVAVFNVLDQRGGERLAGLLLRAVEIGRQARQHGAPFLDFSVCRRATKG